MKHNSVFLGLVVCYGLAITGCAGSYSEPQTGTTALLTVPSFVTEGIDGSKGSNLKYIYKLDEKGCTGMYDRKSIEDDSVRVPANQSLALVLERETWVFGGTRKCRLGFAFELSEGKEYRLETKFSERSCAGFLLNVSDKKPVTTQKFEKTEVGFEICKGQTRK